jgi:chorismate mutase
LSYEKEVELYRITINKLNAEIIELLRERAQAALKIGEIKQRYGKPIVDEIREEKVIQQVKERAIENELDPEKVERIFKEIIQLCVEAEKAISD